jgi:hypothetical protein
MFDFENCVMKIMSKSQSRRRGRLMAKLKLTEKEENLHIRKFLLYFRYSTVAVVAEFNIIESTKSVVLNFPAASSPP